MCFCCILFSWLLWAFEDIQRNNITIVKNEKPPFKKHVKTLFLGMISVLLSFIMGDWPIQPFSLGCTDLRDVIIWRCSKKLHRNKQKHQRSQRWTFRLQSSIRADLKLLWSYIVVVMALKIWHLSPHDGSTESVQLPSLYPPLTCYFSLLLYG